MSPRRSFGTTREGGDGMRLLLTVKGDGLIVLLNMMTLVADGITDCFAFKAMDRTLIAKNRMVYGDVQCLLLVT